MLGGCFLLTVMSLPFSAIAWSCRSDIIGPNYYAKERSSYEWCPYGEWAKREFGQTVWAGNVASVTLAQLLVVFDYSDVHHHASNVLFGDCHVASGN